MGLVFDEAPLQPLAAIDVHQQGVWLGLQLGPELGGIQGLGGVGAGGGGAAVARQAVAVGGKQRSIGRLAGEGGQREGNAGEASE
ncbi:hypothetical protein D3C85_1625480 [compost metagenome]